MKMGRVTRKGGRAFTLVEIMVVVGILSIVLAMGVPAFVRVLTKETLRQATSDLQDGLAHARAQAILQGSPTEFILNSADGSMSVRLAPETVAGPAGAPPHLPASAETPLATDSGVSANGSMPAFSAKLHPDIAVALVELNLRSQMDQQEVRVRFHPNGTSDDFTIVIESPAGMRKVFLDPITGRSDMEAIR